jgi:hypothetical protein
MKASSLDPRSRGMNLASQKGTNTVALLSKGRSAWHLMMWRSTSSMMSKSGLVHKCSPPRCRSKMLSTTEQNRVQKALEPTGSAPPSKVNHCAMPVRSQAPSTMLTSTCQFELSRSHFQRESLSASQLIKPGMCSAAKSMLLTRQKSVSSVLSPLNSVAMVPWRLTMLAEVVLSVRTSRRPPAKAGAQAGSVTPSTTMSSSLKLLDFKGA